MKTCTRCKLVKPLDQFYRNRGTWSSRCRPCAIAMARPGSETERLAKAEAGRRHNLRRFGLTPTDYDALLTHQGGVCALCGLPPGERRLAVDHRHSDGMVRGLLHFACNSRLGHLEANPDWYASATEYLRALRGARKAKGATPRAPKATSTPEPAVSTPRVYGKLTVSRDLGGTWWVTDDGVPIEPVKSRDAGRARIVALKA